MKLTQRILRAIRSSKPRPLIVLAALSWLGVTWTGAAAAQKVRIAMPAKIMTFLNFYVGDKFGIYKAEGFEVSLEVIKPDVGVAGMVAGEIDKAFSKDGTTSEDAVKLEIREIREQAKIKAEVPVSQVVDYKLLEEVLAEMKK